MSGIVCACAAGASVPNANANAITLRLMKPSIRFDESAALLRRRRDGQKTRELSIPQCTETAVDRAATSRRNSQFSDIFSYLVTFAQFLTG